MNYLNARKATYHYSSFCSRKSCSVAPGPNCLSYGPITDQSSRPACARRTRYLQLPLYCIKKLYRVRSLDSRTCLAPNAGQQSEIHRFTILRSGPGKINETLRVVALTNLKSLRNFVQFRNRSDVRCLCVRHLFEFEMCVDADAALCKK
jgi:hypothetical protein